MLLKSYITEQLNIALLYKGVCFLSYIIIVVGFDPITCEAAPTSIAVI